jgi:hypothetical protein
MVLARVSCLVSLLWLVALVVLFFVFAAARSCEGESCNSQWFASLILLSYTALAGVIFLPLGIWAAGQLSRDRASSLTGSSHEDSDGELRR